MKRFRVIITEPAMTGVRATCEFIRLYSPSNAAAWRAKFDIASSSLCSLPERCPIAPESTAVEFEIRQLLFGKYRILFTIRGETVAILNVRHGSREWMKADEIISPQLP